MTEQGQGLLYPTVRRGGEFGKAEEWAKGTRAERGGTGRWAGPRGPRPSSGAAFGALDLLLLFLSPFSSSLWSDRLEALLQELSGVLLGIKSEYAEMCLVAEPLSPRGEKQTG